jgi:nicotinamidase-related amidase
MQQGWRHPTATEQVMQRVIELCGTFDGEIVHSCFQNDPHSLFYKQLKWFQFTESPDIDIIPEIRSFEIPIYWRTTYSCITDELEPVLRSSDEVFIAGVFTDISVTATAMQLFDMGIAVSVVADAVGTLHGADVHEAALKSLGHAIGFNRLVTADSVKR